MLLLPGNPIRTARPRLFGLLVAGALLGLCRPPSLAQSPSYSITLALADTVAGAVYATERTWCELPEAVQTAPATPFSADTSAIPWQALPAGVLAQAACTHHRFTGDSLHFGNQGWLFEHLFRFEIVRRRPHTQRADTMTLTLPIQQHAFVTHVDLQAVPFQAGHFDLTDQLQYEVDTARSQLLIRVPPGFVWEPRQQPRYPLPR